MQTRDLLMVLILTGTADGSFASESSTRWTLRNEAQETLRIACKNISVELMEIALPEQSIAGAGQIVYDWGQRYYNDGLWLNPGKWTCTMAAAWKGINLRRTETFATEWGENITLILSRSDEQLRLRKLPSDAPLADKRSLNKGAQ